MMQIINRNQVKMDTHITISRQDTKRVMYSYYNCISCVQKLTRGMEDIKKIQIKILETKKYNFCNEKIHSIGISRLDNTEEKKEHQ